jgi:hypothetical protein
VGARLDTLSGRRGGHHHATWRGPDLVVESAGRRHSFSGRAWIPSLVPADFPLAALSQ